jgi:hypothetical protein
VSLARSLGLACAVLLVGAGPAMAGEFTIDVRGSADGFGRVLAIGDFKPSRNPTLGAAVDAYGVPSSKRRVSRRSCKVTWNGPGVKILFANLGGGAPCGANRARAQTARAFGARWRTAKGLRVGQRLAQLRNLYTRATQHGDTWWLVTALNPIGTPHRYPVLSATVRDRTVRSFSLQILAAGD